MNVMENWGCLMEEGMYLLQQFLIVCLKNFSKLEAENLSFRAVKFRSLTLTKGPKAEQGWSLLEAPEESLFLPCQALGTAPCLICGSVLPQSQLC